MDVALFLQFFLAIFMDSLQRNVDIQTFEYPRGNVILGSSRVKHNSQTRLLSLLCQPNNPLSSRSPALGIRND
jgi:hypothetical protein